jgi:CO/xanthine dehydrogenase FAD-binding subunit
MTVFVPTSLESALDALSSSQPPQVLAGGTDFMVEVNFGHRRFDSVVSVSRVAELKGVVELSPPGLSADGSFSDISLGACLTYTEMMEPTLARRLPALAMAARTVGSPQIRNAGTIGGNIATASPAGDTLPVLLALDAQVELVSASGSRQLSLEELLIGPKKISLDPHELILRVLVPGNSGQQEFLKIGTRNAMVIAVASLALVVNWESKQVRCALGSVGPTALRAREAEGQLSEELDFEERELRRGPESVAAFSAQVQRDARPIDDHRSTAAYRRHAVGVCAARALERIIGGAKAAPEAA